MLEELCLDSADAWWEQNVLTQSHTKYQARLQQPTTGSFWGTFPSEFNWQCYIVFLAFILRTTPCRGTIACWTAILACVTPRATFLRAQIRHDPWGKSANVNHLETCCLFTGLQLTVWRFQQSLHMERSCRLDPFWSNPPRISQQKLQLHPATTKSFNLSMDTPAPWKTCSDEQSYFSSMTGKVVMWPRVCPSTSWQLRRSGSKRLLNTMTVSDSDLLPQSRNKSVFLRHWNLMPPNKTRRLQQLQTPNPSLDGSAMKVSNPLPSFFEVPRLQLWTSKMGCRWGKGRRFNRASKAPKVICGEPMAWLEPTDRRHEKKWSGKTWPQ